MKKFYCLDCKKEINEKRAKRCKHCAHLAINFSLDEVGKRSKTLKGRKFSKETIEKMSKARIGCIPWNKGLIGCFEGYWLGKSNKYIIAKHHIDGNKKNNDKTNFLEIEQGRHRSLHWRGYEYLAEIGLIYDYLKDFFLKYEILDSKIEDGKVVHHIDCNRKNNNPDNLMYLKDKRVHNKLHQEAYLYLVRTNKVNDYISWFLLREEERFQKTEAIEELKKS